MLYSATPGEGADGPRGLEKDARTHLSPGVAGQESVFVQWLSREVFPESTRILSDWTAGPGQSCLGADARQRVDALLCLPGPDAGEEDGGGARPVRLAYVNYHGRAFHGDGRHLPDCPRRPGDGAEDDVKEEEEEEGGRAARLRRSEQESHRRACHRFRPQTLYWPGSGGRLLSANVSAAGPTKDQAEDATRVRLAAALSEAAADAGLRLTVTYHAVHECQLFDNYRNLDGRKLLDAGPADTSAPPVFDATRPACPRRHLRERHRADVIVDPPEYHLGTGPARPLTQTRLVRRLLETPDNAKGGVLGGFLLLRGGRLAPSSSAADANMGYCIQRLPTAREEVGAFTRWQASRIEGGDEAQAERLLLRYCSGELTVARRTFPDSGELVGADLFRWLVREKGLVDYKIQHYLYFPHTHYLTPFFEGMAQRRHVLLRAGGAGGVEEQSVKQISNSAYGQSCMQADRYPTTSVVSDAHLLKKRLLDDPRVSDATLLGAVCLTPRLLDDDDHDDGDADDGVEGGRGGTCKPGQQPPPPLLLQKKKKKNTSKRKRNASSSSQTTPAPRLLFALTRTNLDAKICNVAQLAASVLSNSRVIFMGALSQLLTDLLDPRLAELCYTDTDSCLWATAHEDLEDCLREGVAPERLRSLLVDADSAVQQGGRLKLEGTFTAALFRSPKCYALTNRLDPSLDTRRMRSVARRAQALLQPHHYGQNPETQGVVVGRVSLRPTKGFQMTLQEEFHKTTHGFNFQRRADVSPS